MKEFDLAVVGGGPGGYVAAIRAAKLGLSVALIEGRDLGGTCLNRGCIPSKTLLKQVSVIDQIKDTKRFGVHVNDFSFSIEEMISHKNNIVDQLRKGINGLLQQNKITIYNGFGYVDDSKKITIKSDGQTEEITAKNIILANGSRPFVPSFPGLDEIDIHTSDTIFDIVEVPKHMVIVGGGVIGVEIACILNGLEANVEIVEMADRILPSEDEEAAKFLTKELTKKGVTFHLGTKITGFKKETDQIYVEMEKDGEVVQLPTNSVLISVGRKPNIVGLEELSIKYDGPFVKVNQFMETSIPGIYAIGDLIGGYQLAHVASNEGIRAVDHILDQPNNKKPFIPRCVYSFPEIASVGLTETEAKEAGYKVKVKKVDLAGNGKAIAAGENNGFMKIIADQEYGEVLGVVMIGTGVTEMISQATAFMHLEGTVEEMESMIFPHPTVSEALFEGASAWLEKGIHYQ